MQPSSPARQKIIASLMDLLERKALSSIKTTDIIRASGVSHQTFYRHFLDKLDAAEAACYACLVTAKAVVGGDSTVKEETVCILNIIKSHAAFFKHLLSDSDGENIIRSTLVRLSAASIDFKSSPTITNAWLYCLTKWSKNNFAQPVEQVYLEIISNYPIREVIFGADLKRQLEKYGSYTMSELTVSCGTEDHRKL